MRCHKPGTQILNGDLGCTCHSTLLARNDSPFSPMGIRCNNDYGWAFKHKVII
jgi:hypothetical protein